VNPFVDTIVAEAAHLVDLPRDEIERLIEVPNVAGRGDYALPCFTLAPRLGRAPKAIAAEIAAGIKPSDLIASVEAVGPYVNFFVNRPRFVTYVLTEFAQKRERFGDTDEGFGKTVVIDYSSPNIAKPFGVGHLRSTVIGAAIAKTYEALGYTVVRLNHLGDWGTQFGKLIVAYERWGSEADLSAHPIETLFDLYVRFHKEAESEKGLEDEARLAFKRLEVGDPSVRALWKRFRALSLEEFSRIYERLGARFDSYAGESSYVEMTDAVIKLAESKGLATVSDEALIVDLSADDMPPCILRKKDESTLYATRDLAAAIDRKRTYDFDKLIYVVGMPQKLYFRQMFRVFEKMGFDWVKDCVHVDFGLIRFKDAMMSTRRGNIVFLEDLLNRSVELARKIIEEKNPTLEGKEEVAEQVGVGAVVFADLSSRRVKDVDFDWDAVLDFDGETGPYIQYTCVRLASIVRKSGEAVDPDADFSLLINDHEMQLARMLETFSRVLRRAADSYEPSVLARYLLDVASAANSYYRDHKVLLPEEGLRKARLVLVEALRVVLRKGLSLLGVQTPARM